MPNPRAGYNEEILEYAKQLEVWSALPKENRPTAPSVPWVLTVDMATEGRSRPCGTTELVNRVNNGYFDAYKVVVFHEKHGNRFFSVRKPDDYARIAIKIVKERYERKWYPQINDPILQPEKPKITVEQALDMDAEIRVTVEQLWKEYAQRKRNALEQEEDVALLKTALHEGHGLPPPSAAIAAVHLLALRRRYEYEGYDVITPEEA